MSAHSDCGMPGCGTTVACWSCISERERSEVTGQLSTVAPHAHPEDAVINEIDRLIDSQLAGGDRSHAWAEPLQAQCPRCGGEWHGLANRHCPGPFAEGEADEPYVDQVMAVQYAEITELASRTATPQQVFLLDDQGTDVVGGPYVPLIQCGEFDEESLAGWGFIPNPGVLQQVPSLEIHNLFDELVEAVVTMIGAVCGIFLPDNGIQRIIDTVNEMTQAARENQQRHQRLRGCALVNGGTAPPRGYSLADIEALREDIHRHADHRREAVQGLRSPGHYIPSPVSDVSRWTAEARPEMCDPRPALDQAQQSTGACDSD